MKTPKIVKFEASVELSSKDAVEVIESALREAKNGKVTSVAIALVRTDGAIGTRIPESIDNIGLLLGAVSLLQYRLMKDIEEDNDG